MPHNQCKHALLTMVAVLCTTAAASPEAGGPWDALGYSVLTPHRKHMHLRGQATRKLLHGCHRKGCVPGSAAMWTVLETVYGDSPSNSACPTSASLWQWICDDRLCKNV